MKIEITNGAETPVTKFFSAAPASSRSCCNLRAKRIAQLLNEKEEARLDRERVEEAQKELSSIHRWIERNHPDGFIDSLTYFQNLDRITENWYDRLDRLEIDAKRFVRERDEAIFSKNTSAADFLKQIRQITLCKDVAREKLLMAEKERDETRKQFVDFLNKTEDYKRERDEARAAIPVGEWVEYADYKRVHDAASRLLVAINKQLPIGIFSLIETEYRSLKDAIYGREGAK